MKISKDALKIIAKGSLGISKAVSPNSIGVDLSGLAGEGKDESKTPDPKDKNKKPDTKPDTKPDPEDKELNLKEIEKYSSTPDEGELGFPKFSSFETAANQYQGQEHKAPYPPF